MTVESVTFIGDLDPTKPGPADPKSEGDDHLRNLKKALQSSLVGLATPATDGGAANAYTITPANPLPSYGARMLVAFSPTAANTGPATLNISGLGAKALVAVDGQPLLGNDLIVGSIYTAIYDGAKFRLTSVTKNYADQLAFSSALPGLSNPANEGKFVKVAGGAASYAFPGISVVSATVTTSTTLTGAYLYVPVQMASMGQSVTLPAATSLTVGGPLYIIDNTKGAYPAGIRDSAGTLLMAVGVGGVAYVALKDASTAAGVWTVAGSGLEPGLITIDQTLPSALGFTLYAPYVALDANTSIHFVNGPVGGFAAIVVDNTGKTVSAPATVDSTAGVVPRAAFKISATQAIVFYGPTATPNSAVVLTISGSSPSLSVAVGTPASTATVMSSNWAGEDSVNAPRIAQLTPTLYVTGWGSSNILGFIAISVSGSTVTIGSAATTTSSSISAGSVVMYPLSANSALALYVTGATPLVTASMVTIVGTVVTINTPASLSTPSSPLATPSAALLSPTKAVVAFANAGANAAAVTVSGTSVSWGAAVKVDSGTVNNGDLTFDTSGTASRFNQHIWATGTNTAAIWFVDSAGKSIVATLTESGGTVTVGAKLYGSFSTAASGASGYGYVGMQGTSEFVAINQIGAANAWRDVLVPHKISGATITYGDSQALPELSPVPVASALPIARLSQGDYLVFGANAQAVPVFRSNGDAIGKRGAISLPNMGGPNAHPIPIVSSNRIVLLSTTAGSITSSTQQLRLLNLEVAA